MKIRKKQTSKIKKIIPLEKTHSNKNYKKSIVKIFTSLSFGIIFTVIFFEIALFIFGKLQNVLQDLQNKLTREDEFIILTLGESTTVPILNLQMRDYSWPAALERLLNEKSLNKRIRVINEGKESVNSDRILNDLEKNLEKYDPNLVISMMGINDYFGEIAYETAANIEVDSLLSKSRTYKLIKFLIANVKDKIQLNTKEEFDCYSEESCLHLASIQRENDFYETELAIKFLNKALEYNPNNVDAMIRLGNRHALVYSQNKTERIQDEKTVISGIKYFEKAIELDPTTPAAYSGLIDALVQSVDIENEFIVKNTNKVKENIEKYQIVDANIFFNLANCAKCHGENELIFFGSKKRLDYLQKALVIEPNNTNILIDIARYHIHHNNLKEAEPIYLKVIEINKKDPDHAIALIELANIYLTTNREEMANKIFEQAMNKNGMYPKNYRKLYEILNKKNIKLIAAQYPMRSIEPLELIFKNDEVLIVDNELLFESVIKEDGYDQFFVDRFAGDFGHCSEKGNLLLAENIASVILENWEELSGEN